VNASTKTIATSYGELPVVGIWRECEPTARGWRGIDEAGVIVNVSYQPGCTLPWVAKIPDDNYLVRVVNGRRDGVFLLERKVGKAHRRKVGKDLRRRRRKA
jgi:hypothetical protein